MAIQFVQVSVLVSAVIISIVGFLFQLCMDPSGFPRCSVLYSDDEDTTTATSQGNNGNMLFGARSLCFE